MDIEIKNISEVFRIIDGKIFYKFIVSDETPSGRFSADSPTFFCYMNRLTGKPKRFGKSKIVTISRVLIDKRGLHFDDDGYFVKVDSELADMFSKRAGFLNEADLSAWAVFNEVVFHGYLIGWGGTFSSLKSSLSWIKTAKKKQSFSLLLKHIKI